MLIHTLSLGKAESLTKVVARMAAKDGLSFHVLATSNDIRQGLLARGFKRPLQHHTGKQEQVMLFGNDAKAYYSREISKRKEQGERFSVSYDEWTSIRNRRFLAIIIHAADDQFHTGLGRIVGSCNSEQLIELLREHLVKFGLNLDKDIVAIMCDGTSMNKKLAAC